MVHSLKVYPQYFSDLVSGKKTFEVRYNDRDFKVGDIIALNEVDDTRTSFTGNFVVFEITYVFDDPDFVREGYVILGLRRGYFSFREF